MTLGIFRSSVLIFVVCSLADRAPAQSQVLSWGNNFYGQCAVPALPSGTTYVQISADRYYSVSQSDSHANCAALRSDGTITVWGEGTFGQLNVPALPPGVTYTQVAAGAGHLAAVRSDGEIVAWGSNGSGQCNVSPPPPGLGYVQVVAGNGFTAALLSDGTVAMWGMSASSLPTPPPGISYAKLAAGSTRVVALLSDGSIVQTQGATIPALPPGLVYTGVAAGLLHAIALRSDGDVVAWGSNTYGQCSVPPLPPGQTYTQIAAGSVHSVALRSDGAILGWGYNYYGECSAPILPIGHTCVEIAAGEFGTMARVDTGDCNGNGIADALDVQGGTSQDCDANGIPDECDLAYADCDGNGAVDECEIAANPSLDLNGDGVLDACCQRAWQPAFGGPAGLDGTVRALATFNDGTGNALYAGGSFLNAGGQPAMHLAKWNGAAWSPVGGGVDGGDVYTLKVLDLGSGPALYVGGAFTSAGGSPASHVARWDGTAWQTFGSLAGTTTDMAVFDDGGGVALFVTNGQLSKWGGASWTYINPLTIYGAESLVVHDDGGGAALFVGGGGLAPRVWRWDGSQTTGISVPLGEEFGAMCQHDDGSGQALYVGSAAYFSGPQGLVRWTPGGYSLLGSGVSADYAINYYSLRSLLSFDDGEGRALYASGSFSIAGGLPAHRIARWRDGQWRPMGSGLDGVGYAMAAFDDGTGPALFVGGSFGSSGGLSANHVAKWGLSQGCDSVGLIICQPGVSGVLACPCSNPPQGLGLGCDNSSGTGGARLRGAGSTRISHDTMVLTTSGETPSAASIVLQATAWDPTGWGFGQGVRCTTGLLRRLYMKSAIAGSISAPDSGDPSVTARSAALGDSITAGTHRYYGVYYRDPAVLGGCPSVSTYNITQQLSVVWLP